MNINERAYRELQEHYLRVKSPSVANELWSELLTEEDRQQLGGNLDKAHRRGGPVSMWMRVRGVSKPRAIVELAERIGFLLPHRAQWLLRELGEVDEPSPESPQTPRWAPEEGRLYLGQQVIRDVKVQGTRTSIQSILDAFQQAEWPPSLPSPFSNQQPSDLRQAVYRLNRGLKAIRFHVQGGGSEVRWERTA